MNACVDQPQLWHFRLSHYNEKVRWALDYKQWPHTRRALVPGFHIPVARGLSGQPQLPIMELDGRVLVGSSQILAEIERLRPQPPLFPQDAEQRRRAIELEAYFDSEVAPDLRRLFWSAYLQDPGACARMATDGFSLAVRHAWRVALPFMRPLLRRNLGLADDQLAAARQRMHTHFDRLESGIGPGGYLVGDAFGVADLTAAAVLSAIIRPPQFPYPLPEPWPRELLRLRDSMSQHPAFRWVLDMYARHRGASSEIGAR